MLRAATPTTTTIYHIERRFTPSPLPLHSISPRSSPPATFVRALSRRNLVSQIKIGHRFPLQLLFLRNSPSLKKLNNHNKCPPTSCNSRTHKTQQSVQHHLYSSSSSSSQEMVTQISPGTATKHKKHHLTTPLYPAPGQFAASYRSPPNASPPNNKHPH